MSAKNTQQFVELYRSMRAARRLDEIEGGLSRRGEATFHLVGAGHEGTAALAPHLTVDDWLHPHYRDRALILARGASIAQYLHGLLATAEADAQGRRMPPFVCDPARHLLSIPTLVGNNALQAVGVAAQVRAGAGRPVVLCGLGDGGSQQGEFLEAVAEAVRSSLPVLFLIVDNHYALSTPTRGRTFYSRPDGEAAEFYGVPIERVDGARVPEACEAFGRIVAGMREDRRPRLVVCDVERLASHSNSDDQTMYRSEEEIRTARERRDPLVSIREHLRALGVDDATVAGVDAEVEAEIRAGLAAARAAAAPAPGSVKRPLPADQVDPSREYRGGDGEGRRLTMLEAMRATLRHRLGADERVRLYGQDIEDPKGDVFGLTRGLTRAFPGRVANSPLSEATIVGGSIGRALAGARPVAFLQFADFYPVAYNQLFSELGMMYWRTAGAWEAPVLVLAITGGYRPGLGPCHAQVPDGALAAIPGVDVLSPATAGDAAGLLNAAFASGRPAVFLYPKNLLNERAVATTDDVERHFVPIGRARTVRAGNELTLVAWGDTVALCERAAEALEKAGAGAEVIDLRSLSPWDRETVLASAARTGRMIVVHEDRRTGGLGAEIVSAVSEQAGTPVAVARVTTPDTYIPYNFENQLAVLPSFRRVLEEAARLLELDLAWETPPEPEPGIVVVKAIGSSPSDETIRIAELHVAEGDELEEGALIAGVEAEKAAFEINAPATGVVESVLAAEGDELPVGTPLLRLRVPEEAWQPPPPEEREDRPVLSRPKRAAGAAPKVARAAVREVDATVTLSTIATVLGSREMSNDEFLDEFPDWTSADVMQRTGIERRYWVGEGENALTLAARACRELLERERLKIADIDVLICSTGTPLSMTPSLACRVLRDLSPSKGEVMVQAYDVNAACSGYLYALQNAYDILKSRPEAKIMVVTAETLSPVLDLKDPGTAFLFGDAATASLVSREPGRDGVPMRLHRPVLSAKGEEDRVLFVPFPGTGEFVHMEGQQVFRVAVRKMVEMLERACAEAGVGVDELAMIVPHQANTRIIESIRQKIKLPSERMFNHIRNYGNTSSNTIPLALEQVLPKRVRGDRVGLCAFGGGFTFGASILDVL